MTINRIHGSGIATLWLQTLSLSLSLSLSLITLPSPMIRISPEEFPK